MHARRGQPVLHGDDRPDHPRTPVPQEELWRQRHPPRHLAGARNLRPRPNAHTRAHTHQACTGHARPHFPTRQFRKKFRGRTLPAGGVCVCVCVDRPDRPVRALQHRGMASGLGGRVRVALLGPDRLPGDPSATHASATAQFCAPCAPRNAGQHTHNACRVGHQDMAWRTSPQGKAANQYPEWVWQGSQSLGKSAELFAGQLTVHGYGEESRLTAATPVDSPQL